MMLIISEVREEQDEGMKSRLRIEVEWERWDHDCEIIHFTTLILHIYRSNNAQEKKSSKSFQLGSALPQSVCLPRCQCREIKFEKKTTHNDDDGKNCEQCKARLWMSRFELMFWGFTITIFPSLNCMHCVALRNTKPLSNVFTIFTHSLLLLCCAEDRLNFDPTWRICQTASYIELLPHCTPNCSTREGFRWRMEFQCRDRDEGLLRVECDAYFRVEREQMKNTPKIITVVIVRNSVWKYNF